MNGEEWDTFNKNKKIKRTKISIYRIQDETFFMDVPKQYRNTALEKKKIK